jgi:hypothetical protein
MHTSQRSLGTQNGIQHHSRALRPHVDVSQYSLNDRGPISGYTKLPHMTTYHLIPMHRTRTSPTSATIQSHSPVQTQTGHHIMAAYRKMLGSPLSKTWWLPIARIELKQAFRNKFDSCESLALAGHVLRAGWFGVARLFSSPYCLC